MSNREDVPPPDSRPVSRRTGRSSGQHPQLTYCQVDGSEVSSLNEGNSQGHTPVKYAPVEYDGDNGYAV